MIIFVVILYVIFFRVAVNSTMSPILQAALNEIVYIVRFSSSLKGRKYFVYGPTAQRTEDKIELWTIIKNDSEVFARLKAADTGLVESELERRVLKLIPNVPSVEEEATLLAEDAITREPENPFTTGSNDQTSDVNEINKPEDESESGGKFSDKRDFKIRKVRVDNFGRKENVEDCKAFLKEFEDVISVERVDGREHSHGSYDVTFENEKCARKFFKIKKIKYKERTLRRRLLYSCSHCPKSYFSLLCLFPHVTKDHDGDHFECNDCGKTFSKKKYMDAHKIQEHQDSEFICVTCKKKFKFKLGLLSHLEFGGFCPHQCQWCLKTFTRKNDLEKHRKICQSEKQPGGTCSICSKSFELKWDIVLHRKKITDVDGSYKYWCGCCGQIFCDIMARLDHIHAEHKAVPLTHFEKIVRLFPCENCGLNLQSKKDLLKHLETHIDRRSRTKRAPEKLKCELCHYEFTVKKSLDSHMLGVYDEHGSPRYRCEECNIVFCIGNQLKKHRNEKHSDCVCSSCDQRFTTKRALESHLKKQEMFNCLVCGKQFCNKKSFKAHTNRHRGDEYS